MKQTRQSEKLEDRSQKSEVLSYESGVLSIDTHNSELKTRNSELRTQNSELNNSSPLILDMTKLNNLNCGLGQISLNFANELINQYDKIQKFSIYFLVKPNQKEVWNSSPIVKTIKTNWFRRFFSVFNRNEGIWHSIHQDSKFLPRKNSKYILTIHDLNFLESNDKKKIDRNIRILQKKVNRASAVCFISNYVKDIASKNLNLEGKDLQVIYNGLPCQAASQKPNIKIGDKKFLFNIGVLMPKKNHESIIKMMAHLPDYNLIIAGGGKTSYKNQLIKTAEGSGVSDRVHFVGIISDAEKTWYYQNAEAFVFPSLAEGFGLPVIEAMNAGLPVFCSDKTSLPEIGSDKAFYFSNFDPEQMAKLVTTKLNDNNVKSEEFKNNLISYSENFSWHNNVDRYIDIYKNMIK
ncbi:MAG: glycosyltransferase family 4 protein [Bacteroidales bacterium]|jgi:glycosyltransferase involved in cell wall biosynthesis